MATQKNRVRLTAGRVEAFVCQPGKSQGFLWDTDTPTLALRATPTGRKTYVYKEVAPGKHTIASKAENTDTLEVDVQPGTLNYVWQEVKMGILYARTKLHLVPEAEGKAGVQECNLVDSQ